MTKNKLLNKLSPKQQQWFWFVTLWFFGLFSITFIAGILKLFIKFLSH